MRRLNNILEQGFKDHRFNLSDGERGDLWESIAQTMARQEADVAASSGLSEVWWKRPLYWSLGAIAAAIVAGVIMFKPSVHDVTPASDGSGVVAQTTPFQPNALPMEKTTEQLDKANDRDGATTSVLPSYDKANVSGANSEVSPKNNPETSSEIVETTDVQEVETPASEIKPQGLQEAEPEVQSGTKSEVKQEVSGTKETKTKGKKKEREYEIGGNSSKKGIADNSKFQVGASSNLSKRGDLSTANTNYIKSIVAQSDYMERSGAPSITPLSESSYSLPFNFTISLTYNITDRFAIGSGVSYTYLHNKYDGIIDGQTYNIKQGLHFVGIPLTAYYRVVNKNNWNFYISGGGTVEKGVRAHYILRTGVNKQSINSHVKGVQFSLNTGLGLEYMFGGNNQYGIYLEPRGVYYFDSDMPNSIRTNQPFQFDLQVGLRLHIK